MKIPNKLKIAGYDYEIILRDRVKEDGTDIAGSHLSYCQKIFIDNTFHKQQQESTLIHEILEAINKAYQLELSHQTISTLETALHQVLKDNNLLK